MIPEEKVDELGEVVDDPEADTDEAGGDVEENGTVKVVETVVDGTMAVTVVEGTMTVVIDAISGSSCV